MSLFSVDDVSLHELTFFCGDDSEMIRFNFSSRERSYICLYSASYSIIHSTLSMSICNPIPSVDTII